MIRSIIKNGYVTALDIGTGKICCLVARVSNGSIQIIGDGYAQAKGFKNGLVVNLNEAASSIQDAVMMAEEKSDRRIQNVIVNISSPQLKFRQNFLNIIMRSWNYMCCNDFAKP